MPKPQLLNNDVIKRWRRALLDSDGPRFNIDLPVLEHTEPADSPKRFEGDPGFFLAYMKWEDDEEIQEAGLAEWLALPGHETERLITAYTGIPEDVAKQLLEPKELWEVNYPTRKLTAAQFVSVLDHYLDTGLVLWQKVLIDNPRFRIATEDKVRA